MPRRFRRDYSMLVLTVPAVLAVWGLARLIGFLLDLLA